MIKISQLQEVFFVLFVTKLTNWDIFRGSDDYAGETFRLPRADVEHRGRRSLRIHVKASLVQREVAEQSEVGGIVTCPMYHRYHNYSFFTIHLRTVPPHPPLTWPPSPTGEGCKKREPFRTLFYMKEN